MDFKIVSYLFILGAMISTTVCFFSCSPVFYFIFSLTEKELKPFFYSFLKYSITKFIIQVLSVTVIYLIFGRFFTLWIKKFYGYILLILGFLFILLGFKTVGMKISLEKVLFLKQSFLPQFLGFISGINLCIPKIFVYGYILTHSKNVSDVIFYSSSFTLGECLSPIIILFSGINWIKKFFIEKVKLWLNYVVGTVFFLLGMINFYLGIGWILK